MLRRSESPLQSACQARFPAWTLYARTFCGNRSDAEDVVRAAVSRTVREVAADCTPADLHDRVVWEIRTSAAERMEGRGEAGLLALISRPRDGIEARWVAEMAHDELEALPRPLRRALDGTLLLRPPRSLARQAARSGVGTRTLERRIDEGLERLAAGLRRATGGRRPEASVDPAAPSTRHVRLRDLLAYVQGALSGDEARAVASHAGACARCGDRLGGMMLLRSRATEAVRAPRIPRWWKAGALTLAVAALLLMGVVTIPRLLPNPWAEHASRQTVPRWYHDFFYGAGRQMDDRLVARGLDLLVQGRYQAVIEVLEPLLERRGGAPEVAAYLGIARYLLGDTSRETVELLDRGATSGRAGRLAGWYQANVRLARGEVVQARRQLEALARIGDWVGRQARALLERLDRAEAVVSG